MRHQLQHHAPRNAPPTPVWDTLPAVVASPCAIAAIQGAEQRAALYPGNGVRVDADGAHRAEVDHHAAVRDAEADHAVPAAANPDLEAALRP
jgi:hypothetical protein